MYIYIYIYIYTYLYIFINIILSRINRTTMNLLLKVSQHKVSLKDIDIHISTDIISFIEVKR